MHKAREIINRFHEQLLFLKEGHVADVVKTDIDTEQDFPLVTVLMGPDTREELTKEMYQHQLTLYTDISVRVGKDSLYEAVLDIREQIELKVLQMQKLDLDFVFRITFQNMGEPEYNGEGVDYTCKTRLEFMVEYFSQHDNPSA